MSLVFRNLLCRCQRPVQVQIAAFNDAAGVEQTAGYQEPSAMAAVGVPSKPSLPSLTVPKDGSGNPIKRALEVT